MPEHLDRRDELVEVHVQDPERHAFSLTEPGPAGGAGSRLGWAMGTTAARGWCRGPP